MALWAKAPRRRVALSRFLGLFRILTWDKAAAPSESRTLSATPRRARRMASCPSTRPLSTPGRVAPTGMVTGLRPPDAPEAAAVPALSSVRTALPRRRRTDLETCSVAAGAPAHPHPQRAGGNLLQFPVALWGDTPGPVWTPGGVLLSRCQERPGRMTSSPVPCNLMTLRNCWQG